MSYSNWTPSPNPVQPSRMSAGREAQMAGIKIRGPLDDGPLGRDQADIDRQIAHDQALTAEEAEREQARKWDDRRRRNIDRHQRKNLLQQQEQRTEIENQALREENYKRRQDAHTRQQLAEPLPEPVSPTRALQARIGTFFRTSSARVRLFTALVGTAVLFFIILYTLKFLGGVCHYGYAYTQAYNGFDTPVGSCVRALRSEDGFWGQTSTEWFHLQRCRAYTAALEVDGELLPLHHAFDLLFMESFRYSPPTYLIALCTFWYFMLSTIKRRLRAWFYYLWHAGVVFWGNTIAAILFVCFILLMSNGYKILGFILIGFCIVVTWFYAIIDNHFRPRFHTAWEAARNNPLARPFMFPLTWLWNMFLEYFQSFSGGVPFTAGSGIPEDCYHIVPCLCFAEKDREIAEQNTNNAALQTEVQTLQASLNEERQRVSNAHESLIVVQNERNEIEERKRGALLPRDWHAPRHNDALSAHWEQRYMARDNDYAQLADQKMKLEKQFRAELERLHKAVEYSRGAGVDREVATSELSEAKVAIRNLERDRNALAMAGMNLRHELAKERETHSEKCQNEAGCQRRIRELEEGYDLVRNSMLEDQRQVTEACIHMGMERREAEHVNIKDYLAFVTIQISRHYALGIGGANTSDIQVGIMEKVVAREATYKNRLEREVERLGGNILDVRIGLDTTRPQDWKMEFMTYEQNLLRIFPIYERLWRAIIDMSEIFERERFVLPLWNQQPVRNDMSSHQLADVPQTALVLMTASTKTDTAKLILSANQKTNPTIESMEVLVEKLVITECLRLYNRGLQLLSFLDSNMTVHANIAGIEHVNRILDEVLHEVLDTEPLLLKNHPSERALNPRKQKKFEIYFGMQTAIEGLTRQIIANKRLPPDWPSTEKFDDMFSKPYSTPENLVVNLANHELAILARRIAQLVLFANEYCLPGTKDGPPRARLQNDPSYHTRWEGLVIARVFAELVISHWNLHKIQKEVTFTDEAGRQLVRWEPTAPLLPLNVEKFRVAVGLSPLRKEDRRWPDDWTARAVNDPTSGPSIVFEPPPPPDQTRRAIEYPGYSNDNNKNDYKPVALTGTAKEIDRQKMVNEWKENQERCQQLYNHVIGYGIKDSIPSYNPLTLRANADPKSMKRDIENQKELQNQYVHSLTRNKKPVPAMIRKGGRMDPHK